MRRGSRIGSGDSSCSSSARAAVAMPHCKRCVTAFAFLAGVARDAVSVCCPLLCRRSPSGRTSNYTIVGSYTPPPPPLSTPSCRSSWWRLTDDRVNTAPETEIYKCRKMKAHFEKKIQNHAACTKGIQWTHQCWRNRDVSLNIRRDDVRRHQETPAVAITSTESSAVCSSHDSPSIESRVGRLFSRGRFAGHSTVGDGGRATCCCWWWCDAGGRSAGVHNGTPADRRFKVHDRMRLAIAVVERPQNRRYVGTISWISATRFGLCSSNRVVIIFSIVFFRREFARPSVSRSCRD